MVLGKEVIIIKTGTANLASVLASFKRLGTSPLVSLDKTLVREAPYVVLPGVGAFGAAQQELAAHELLIPLQERIHNNKPTLAVCLGLQLLCRASTESSGVTGLGIIDDTVVRFASNHHLRVPQMGWNNIEPDPGCRMLRPGFAYFANSYCLQQAPAGMHVAYADYGGRFVAAFERGNLLACQFHPELSGDFGAQILQRWLQCG